MGESVHSEKKYLPYIIGIAILVPLLVTILAYLPGSEFLGKLNYHIFPLLNAIINGTTFIILLTALYFIKKRNIIMHRRMMTLAILFSIIFLVFYIIYHAAVKETTYGGEGFRKYFYYFILITHILLSAAIVPMVLISFVRAISEKFDKHKKIARITLPLWLYVTATGVLVYLMISPYYPS